MISTTEEDYLKAIYHIHENMEGNHVKTSAIAQSMNTSAASVTDMMKRLNEKQLVIHEKYKGVRLTKIGEDIVKKLIRKHRLWEVFLVEKLKFTWDEIHEIAEQLEHIHSPTLTNRLDAFLGHPKFDPHGDPIPDEQGNIYERKQFLLSDLQKGQKVVIVGVVQHEPRFLRYLAEQQLVLGTTLELLKYYEFDGSMTLQVSDNRTLTISSKVSQNLYVKSV
ncbi:MAG: metal-dependent transcriptional regulator [Chitinophagales bacterium]